ncbi:hypothetical protein [Parerythrobacter aestuarii]|uniref:hypothetical protein n=1 Tax=Parerythrobacter aestuarii TaxID=3020909 RepID=UPI0024DE483E|nr:hypothetical protein [Parerythrobacter aestuarii]
MARVTAQPLPPDSLLAQRVRSGDFADCYTAEVPGHVSIRQYIIAFYSSAAFFPERNLLRLIGRGAGPADIAALAAAETESFAAWTIEQRTQNQLLMRDFLGKTRSWLMVEHNAASTRLYFGSWVGAKPGSGRLSLTAHLAYPFHRLYSRILLAGAVHRLSR